MRASNPGKFLGKQRRFSYGRARKPLRPLLPAQTTEVVPFSPLIRATADDRQISIGKRLLRRGY